MEVKLEAIEECVAHDMLKNYPDVLNVAHLCEILGISRKLAYRFLKEENIEYLLIGRSYRIPKLNFIKYLLKSKTKTEV